MGDVWLSALRLNPHHPEVRADIRDVHRMHVRVESCAEGLPLPTGGRLLWSHPREDTLLIQTGAPVSPLAFPFGYLTGPPRVVNLTAKLDGFTRGQPVVWSLVGNPIRTHARPPLPDGTRPRGHRRAVPLHERDAWVTDRLSKSLTVRDMTSRNLSTKSGSRRGTTIVHAYHVWTGSATVADPEELRRICTRGVGHAKGFGCGLLVIT